MSTTESSTDQSAGGDLSPARAFGLVLDVAVGSAATKLQRTTEGWIDKLNGVAAKQGSSDTVAGLADEGLDAAAESGGVAQRAGAEGVKAHVHGRSPTWAAIRAAWHGGSPAVRAAIVTSTVSAAVLLLVSPVLLLVYLVSWLMIEAVSRATRQRRVASA